MEPQTDTSAATRPRRDGTPWLALAILLLAANLRAPIIAVAPVLATIRHDVGLSSSAAGLLTTLPVVCFGAFAPLAPRLARRIGLEATLCAAMALIAAGVLARLAPPVALLFAGTLAIGAAAAVGNVLLPPLVKRDFPRHLGPMTGAYVTALAGGATLAAGVTVPLLTATGAGWRTGIAVWVIPAAAAAVVWAAIARAAGPGDVSERPRAAAGLLRNPLAWQVTLFMGLQSLNYFATTAWIPTLLAGHGLSASAAGLMLSLASLVGIPGALATPVLAGRRPAQHALVIAVVTLLAAGTLGLLIAPGGAPALWMILLGLGQGGSLGLALTLIGLRSPDAEHTSELSGMAQSVGYLLAAPGPVVAGALHDLSGGWGLPLVALLVLLVPTLALGLGAARDLHVSGRRGNARKLRA